jgi:TldD protein
MNKFLELSHDAIDNIYDKSLEVLTKFPIGDLFIENVQSNYVALHNGNFISRSKSNKSGHSVRTAVNTRDICINDHNISEDAIIHNLNEMRQFAKNDFAIDKTLKTNIQNLYKINPHQEINNTQLEEFLLKAEHYLKEKAAQYKLSIDSKVTMNNKIQNVCIINNLSNLLYDTRPYTVLRITVTAERNGNKDIYYTRIGSRTGLQHIIDNYHHVVNELIETIDEMIDAKDSVKGTYPVFFSSGDPGVLIHEAVGHSLEGDFNRQKISVFSEKLHKQIASKCVNIVDDGTVNHQYGSINFDDEGMESKKNILVTGGMLNTYLSGRKDGDLLGSGSTGSGRRENFLTPPIPRMTNTYVEASSPEYISSKEDMLSTYDEFIYVERVGHGAVDICSGQFSFTCNKAFLFKKGHKTPLKRCVFSGMGSEVLMNIEKVGKNVEMSPGFCGKNGSTVPVTCGQTEVLVNKLTLG